MKPKIGKRYLLRYWEHGVLHFDIVYYTNYSGVDPYWEFERNGGRFQIKENDEIICLNDMKFEKVESSIH